MENKGSVEMEEWVKERIEENKELFTTEELVIIQENLRKIGGNYGHQL